MKTIDDVLKEIEEEQLAKTMKKPKPEPHEEPDGDYPDVDGDGNDKDGLAKSFNVTLSDGTKAEAVDGTALIKSLANQIDSQKDKMDWLETDLVKALGAEIAAHGAELNWLRKVGKGARSVMMAKAEPPIAKQDLMAKAFAAKGAGTINSTELDIVDASLRHGVAIDPALLSKIQSI